jgi:glycosidase
VANHVGSQHPWVSDPPLDNWFHGSVGNHLKNPFRADLLLSPHASDAARRPTLDGWFSDDLPDMNQDEPEVARYEIQNSLWWVGVTGIDAIRQDTIQYMPRRFMHELSAALHAEYPKMWMVGEVMDNDPAHTAFFMGGRKGWDGIDTLLDSTFDFPLWSTSKAVFTGKAPARSLRDILKYDAGYPDARRLTTMLSNHDVPRFMSLEGASLEGAMLHTAFLISVRGIPQLYYGEEIAMTGGADPENRRDFPGGFPGDSRNAYEASGRTPDEQRMFNWTQTWLRLRRESSAMRRGDLVDLAFDSDSYVFSRSDQNETIIIGLNRAATSKSVTFSSAEIGAADGASLAPMIGAGEAPRATGGSFTILIPARSAIAYKMS